MHRNFYFYCAQKNVFHSFFDMLIKFHHQHNFIWVPFHQYKTQSAKSAVLYLFRVKYLIHVQFL